MLLPNARVDPQLEALIEIIRSKNPEHRPPATEWKWLRVDDDRCSPGDHQELPATEIENALNEIEGVADALVILDQSHRRENQFATATLRLTREISEEQLESAIRDALQATRAAS
eukprot:COSAG01_NODE_33508_length_563_cov_0.713362_1_plen_114_part_10